MELGRATSAGAARPQGRGPARGGVGDGAGDTGGVSDQDQTPAPQQVTYRRRPQMWSFLITGAVIGLVVGGVVGFFGPETASRSTLQDIVLLGAVGAFFGALLAAIAYLLADRASMRGTR